MKIRIGVNRANSFRLLAILVWTQTILLQYVRALLMRVPVVGRYPDEIITIVFVLGILLALPYYKIYKKDFIFLMLVIAVFLFEMAFYEEGAAFLDRYIIDFIVKILPLYVFGISLSASENKEEIIYQLYILSMVTLAANIFYQFVIGTSMSEVASQYEGNMNLAYNLLPHCCLIAYYTVKRTNILNIVFSIIGGFYLLMLGTRGAALIYLICFAVLLIMGRTSKWAIIRLIVIFGASVSYVSSSLYETSLLWLYQRAQQYGLSVRIFDRLLSKTVTVSEGRDYIREILFEAIKERPFLGHGICSDRVLAGNYAHNIVIELWVEFGVVIGTAFVITLVIVLLRGYLSAKGEGEKGLIFSLICASFCKLFLSGSYLDERLLFLLLGMCVYAIRKRRLDKVR